MENGSCCGEGKYFPGPGPFFGRLLLSIIFIVAGLSKIFNFNEAVQSFHETGIQGAQFFIIIGLLMEIIGGLLILLGWYTRVGVWILMIFLFPTTLIFHAFWLFGEADMMLQLSIFLRNVAIYGGLLLLLSYGPGRWSLDACCCKDR